MNKLPVWNTIRFAYSFAFGQIGSIIGLVWLPTVLIAVLQFLPYALGIQSVGKDQSPSQAVALIYMGCFIAQWLLYAMNAVSVTGLALGTRQAGASVYFSFGWPELRMFGALVLCGLLFSVSYIIYLLGLELVARAPAVAAAAQTFLTAGWLCAVIYAGVRLGFLLIPVVLVEEKIDFLRAWSLTPGNFWRIFAVILAIVLPLTLIQLGAVLAIVGANLLAPLPATQQSIEAAMNASLAVLDKHMAELIGVSLLLAPFNIGLTLGAAASAFRSLAPSQIRRA